MSFWLCVQMIGILVIALTISYLCYYFVHWYSFGKDTTDGDGPPSRLVIYTDKATGVQYLGNIHGGLTPRLNKDGSLYTDPIVLKKNSC